MPDAPLDFAKLALQRQFLPTPHKLHISQFAFHMSVFLKFRFGWVKQVQLLQVQQVLQDREPVVNKNLDSQPVADTLLLVALPAEKDLAGSYACEYKEILLVQPQQGPFRSRFSAFRDEKDVFRAMAQRDSRDRRDRLVHSRCLKEIPGKEGVGLVGVAGNDHPTDVNADF